MQMLTYVNINRSRRDQPEKSCFQLIEDILTSPSINCKFEECTLEVKGNSYCRECVSQCNCNSLTLILPQLIMGGGSVSCIVSDNKISKYYERNNQIIFLEKVSMKV